MSLRIGLIDDGMGDRLNPRLSRLHSGFAVCSRVESWEWAKPIKKIAKMREKNNLSHCQNKKAKRAHRDDHKSFFTGGKQNHRRSHPPHSRSVKVFGAESHHDFQPCWSSGLSSLHTVQLPTASSLSFHPSLLSTKFPLTNPQSAHVLQCFLPILFGDQ